MLNFNYGYISLSGNVTTVGRTPIANVTDFADFAEYVTNATTNWNLVVYTTKPSDTVTDASIIIAGFKNDIGDYSTWHWRTSEITENGDVNTSGIATITVNVPSSGGTQCPDWSTIGWDCNDVAASGITGDVAVTAALLENYDPTDTSSDNMRY